MSLSPLPRRAGRGWLTRLGTERNMPAEERLHYEASLSIPEGHVPAALQALVSHHPHLRRFARRLGGTGEHDRVEMRRNLIDALQLLNHDATRSVTDLGVRILGGSGARSRVEGVLGALAPYARSGSYAEVRSSSERWTWSFDGAGLQRCIEPADVRITGHAAPSGVAR